MYRKNVVDKKSYMGLDCSIFVVTLKVLSSEMDQAKMVSFESSLDKGETGGFSANFAYPHPVRAL
jgi:hypothetical protein